MRKVMFYSKSTGGFYSVTTHGRAMPDDVVEVTAERYVDLMNRPASGQVIVADERGMPILVEPVPAAVTADNLCARIDTAADAARRAVAGDPLRAVEYTKAAEQASAFAAANYLGDVPPMVAAWAIGERTAQQAAENILAEAAQYNGALEHLRAVRLAAKEQIRVLVNDGQTEQAQAVANGTVAAIAAAVAGIGNNA